MYRTDQTSVQHRSSNRLFLRAALENGGTIEKTQLIAAHDSPKTTKLYDRTCDQSTLDKVEQIINPLNTITR